MAPNLADRFEAMADAAPRRTALVDDDRRLTYGELDAEANRLAHHLASHGVGRDDWVGLVARNSAPFVVSLLACLKLRAVPVNVNYRYTRAELAEIFDDSGAVALVVDEDVVGECAVAIAGAAEPHHVVVIGDDVIGDGGNGAALADRATTYADAVGSGSPARDFGPRSGDDVNVLYTGGTTGRPKGVVWRQEDTYLLCTGGNGNDAAVAAARESPDGTSVVLPAGPFVHSSSQWNLLGALLNGRTVVALDRFDAAKVWELCDREQVSYLSVTGDAMVRPLVDALGPDRPPPASIQVVSSSGGLLSPSMKEALARAFPGAAVFDAVGSTETGLLGTAPATAESGTSPELRVTAGPGTLVVDETGRPVAPGETGLLAKGGRIPLRYHNDPEKTARTFITHAGSRYAIPGDAARLEPDGSIAVLGRQSSCINTGGEKVYPNEVESVLKTHPDVRDCIVLGLPDDRWGQRVAAIVEPRPGGVALADLQAHSRAALAGYKVPRALCVVPRIERQPSGKPDNRWTATVAESGAWVEG